MGIRNFRNMGILEIQQLVSQGYLRLIKDTTVSVATTSVTIDTDENSQAFSFGKDRTLMLVADFNNTSGSSSGYELYVNNDQVRNNYYRQRLIADGTNVTSLRSNIPSLAFANSGEKCFVSVPIKLTNDGYFTFETNQNRDYSSGSNLELGNEVVSKTATITSMTRFDIVSITTNAIGVGSRFMLFEVIN